jgi:hypothetical protein
MKHAAVIIALAAVVGGVALIGPVVHEAQPPGLQPTST